jgi:hypothetical protein
MKSRIRSASKPVRDVIFDCYLRESLCHHGAHQRREQGVKRDLGLKLMIYQSELRDTGNKNRTRTHNPDADPFSGLTPVSRVFWISRPVKISSPLLEIIARENLVCFWVEVQSVLLAICLYV